MQIINPENNLARQLQALKKLGTRNKVILALMLIPASCLGYISIRPILLHSKETSGIPESRFILFFCGLCILWIILALVSRSITFVNENRLKYFHFEVKKQLYEILKTGDPEIIGYYPDGRIRPDVFHASGLFPWDYDDYQGDDYIKGLFNGIQFNLCEMHVSRLFHPIFNGIFVHCFHFSKLNFNSELIMNSSAVLDFQKKYHAEIKVSMNHNSLYLIAGMDGYFLEGSSFASIEKLQNDLAMLKDLISIVKMAILSQSKSFEPVIMKAMAN
jgi:hypothetical protein